MDTKYPHASVIPDRSLKFPFPRLYVPSVWQRSTAMHGLHCPPRAISLPHCSGRTCPHTRGDCRALWAQTRGRGSLPSLWVWSHPFFNSSPTNFSSLAPLKIIITDSSGMGLFKLTVLEGQRWSFYMKFMLFFSPFHCLHSDETTRSMNHLGTLCYIYHRNILAKRPSETFLMPPLKPESRKLNDEDNQEFVCLQQPSGQGRQQ